MTSSRVPVRGAEDRIHGLDTGHADCVMSCRPGSSSFTFLARPNTNLL